MKGEACREWRGDLALHAGDRVEPGTEAPLLAHLERCPECRAELVALRRVVAALGVGDADRVDEAVEAPPELPERIVRLVQEERRRRRRGARRRVAAGVAVAAALLVGVVGVLGVLPDGQPAPGVEVVFDEAPSGVRASAELASKPWGTEVSLSVDGLDPGGVYWLWLTDASGKRTGAGTFSGMDGAARVVLAAALPRASASRIWVTDADDRVVLDASLV